MEDDIKIYILTHKEFNEPYDKEIYKPLLCGSKNLKEDYGYIRDDTGDNISQFNNHYSELTGEYWAWKNSNAKIIGFCHFRRFFVKNLLLKKLEKKDIEKIFKKYDIIVAQKTRYNTKWIESLQFLFEYFGEGAQSKEVYKLRKLIEKYSPEYLDSFDKTINGKVSNDFNMFIAKREVVNEYFNWMFPLLDKLDDEINYDEYPENNHRVLGYISEIMITVFINAKNYKVLEKPVILTERKFPVVGVLGQKFPFLSKIERIIASK